MERVPRTDAELRQIAADLYENKIFSSLSIRPEDTSMLGQIFMPVILGCFSEYTREELEDISFIFEYYTERGPLSINGYPMFMSLKIVHKDEAEKISEYFEIYKDFKENFMTV